MSQMNLQYLIEKYNQVNLTANDHRTQYITIDEYISNLEDDGSLQLDDDVRKKMIDSDTIIELQIYPDNPVSFYYVVHYDLQSAIDRMVSDIFEDELKV